MRLLATLASVVLFGEASVNGSATSSSSRPRRLSNRCTAGTMVARISVMSVTDGAGADETARAPRVRG